MVKFVESRPFANPKSAAQKLAKIAGDLTCAQGWAHECSTTKRLIAACKSTTDTKTPRFNRRFVSLAKKPSTALSQDAEVGVKGEVPTGMPGQPLAHLRVLAGSVVVDDGVDRLLDRYLRLNGIEEADELLVPVALHVAADDGTVEDVESSEQRGRTVAFVVVGHRSEA
jgi:hypothetical protein